MRYTYIISKVGETVYLKSIKAYGFKSFADKTEINLCENINGIVGPNGSGKSNVVDAVRWVLGEQSIKSLRGESSVDVIFSGSKSRKALNSASITLVFDNSDLYLPIQYTEVSIRRVMYRSGENEYYLNNEKCRLKDITSLLTDSGADRESFNIIGQGKIDEILSTKPGDRRLIFESAAGVLKYKRRKEEAIRKLERTHNNMDRVNDIIHELENNLVPLQKQSMDASRFLELKDELTNLEVSLIVKDIEYYNFQTKDLKEKIDALNDDLVKLSGNHSSYDIDLLSKRDELKRVDDEINQGQNTLMEITKSIEKIDADIRVLKTRKELEESPDEKQFLSKKEAILKLETAINDIKNKIEEEEEHFKIANNNYQKEQGIHQDFSKEKNKIVANLEMIHRDKARLNYDIDVLEQMIESDNSVPSSVKNILNNKRLLGAYQILGKLINMDSEYQVAITTSLGGAVNYLVVDKASSAKEMVIYLRDNKLGRATFFPLDSVKPRYIDQATLDKVKKMDGFVAVASDVVSSDSKFNDVILNQLGNVIIACDLECANLIGKGIHHRYKIVTLDGQVVNVGGTITGGSSSSGHNYLKDKYEYERLKRERLSLEEKEKDLELKLNEKAKEVEVQERKVYECQQVVIQSSESKNRLVEELNLEKNQLNVYEQELKDMESLQVGESDQRLESMLTMYYSAISNRDNLLKEKEVLISKKTNLEKEILDIEELSKRDSHYTSLKEKNLKELEIQLNTSNIKLDHLLISLGEEYSITFDKAKESYHLEIEEDVARERVKELKSSIKDLGYVNVEAISEYEKVNERYEFLIKQKDDLNNAEDTLLRIVQEMDDIMKERFLRTFEAIRVEFKKVFKEMFGGGEAELVLTEPDNILETGIEIEAVPSGKVLKSISLLSGGEKTFTAISLLFAILNVRPVPFCLLDEVEAALDEANVESFGNYLSKYRDKTQFILITHKKKTMEYADVLYGITMQESGVSKLVSVRLEDLKES